MTLQPDPVDWRTIRLHLAALLLFISLTVWVLGPVVLRPRTLVLGSAGDNMQYAYAVGWTAQALLRGQSPFVDPRLNYPDDLNLATTDLPYVSQMMLAPVTWLLGPVFSYNLIIALGFVLSGLFAYLWVWRLTGSMVGALVAGCAFLLTPYRVVHSIGHLQLISTFAFPLFFWALDVALRSTQYRWRIWLALAGATFLLGSSAQYYLVIGAIGALVYSVLSPRLDDWRVWMHKRMLAASAVAVGALIAALPYLSAMQSRAFVAYRLESTRMWSADPLNFVLPAFYHPLWGELITQIRPEPHWIEKTLYLGWVGLGLALVALMHGRSLLAGRTLAWVGVAVTGFVLALGTDLHLANQPVALDDPRWLPAYYLRELPGLALMRVWARFGVLTVLFVALLAGLGAAALQQRWPRYRLALGMLLVLGMSIDLAPGSLTTTTLQPRPVDHWLAAQAADPVVAALPALHEQVNYRNLFGSLFHARQMPAFMHPTHVTPAYYDFVRRAQGFPHPQSVKALQAIGVRYVLLEVPSFDGGRFPPWKAVAAGIAALDLTVVAEFDTVIVVDLGVPD